jgi:hypothetical protein
MWSVIRKSLNWEAIVKDFNNFFVRGETKKIVFCFFSFLKRLAGYDLT